MPDLVVNQRDPKDLRCPQRRPAREQRAPGRRCFTRIQRDLGLAEQVVIVLEVEPAHRPLSRCLGEVLARSGKVTDDQPRRVD